MNRSVIGVLLLLLGLHFQVHSSLRVLTFSPIPWRSHQFLFRQLVRALGLKGHVVDFYTMLPLDDPPPTVNQILLKDTLKEGLGDFDFNEFVESSPMRNVEMNGEITERMMISAFTSGTEIQDLLKSNKVYDIVITEYGMYGDALVYFAHRFNALNVMLAPMLDNSWVRRLSGLPDNPTYMLSYQCRSDNNFNFIQRLENVVRTNLIDYASYRNAAGRMQAFADKYIRYDGWETRPEIVEMASDAALILMNSHPSMSYPYPLSPHVKEIGGIHIMPPKPLPKDQQEFLDRSTSGVIYFSLGTNVDTTAFMEGGMYDVFLKTFKRFKSNVMWKVNTGMKIIDDSQIKMQTWFPQQDILAHKNCILFITHGGLQSMIEAINTGVPTLTIPFFFDQFKDAAYLSSQGMGVQLSSNNITETSLYWAIHETISNNKYKMRAMKMRSMFQDRLMPPADEAVYWIEYVGRHGKVLQPASVRMPWYQIYMLDIMSFFVVVFFISIFLLKQLCNVIWRSMSRKSPDKEKKCKKI